MGAIGANAAAIGIGGASAGLGILGSASEGRAARRTGRALSRQARFQRAQAVAQRDAEAVSLGREQARALGAIRAAVGSRGISGSPTAARIGQASIFEGLLSQVFRDQSLSDEVVGINLTERQQIRSLRPGSPILAGLGSGLQGLSIGMNLDNLRRGG